MALSAHTKKQMQTIAQPIIDDLIKVYTGPRNNVLRPERDLPPLTAEYVKAYFAPTPMDCGWVPCFVWQDAELKRYCVRYIMRTLDKFTR